MPWVLHSVVVFDFPNQRKRSGAVKFSDMDMVTPYEMELEHVWT